MTGKMRALPLPPLEFRQIVGPTADGAFDNPERDLVFGPLDFAGLDGRESYRAIFDFGCGCGREARRLRMQLPPPERYVGLDTHRHMIAWCNENLAGDGFSFHHHDVWTSAPICSPGNGPDRVRPLLPYGTGFSLINVHSVFTHLYADQVRYYLTDMAAMLGPRGVIRSTWFLFDRAWFPVLAPSQHALYVNEADPSHAVYFDWGFVVETAAQLGLTVVDTLWTEAPGFQSVVYLGRIADFGARQAPTPPGTVMGFGASAAPPMPALLADERARRLASR